MFSTSALAAYRPDFGPDCGTRCPGARWLLKAHHQSRQGMSLFRVVGLLAILSLAGCGTLVGAGAGGYVGNQFGKGQGKAAATAAGAVGGGILGHALTGY